MTIDTSITLLVLARALVVLKGVEAAGLGNQ